jgi:hypothetical protein
LSSNTEFVEENEESEIEDSDEIRRYKHHSQQYSMVKDRPRYSQMSNLNLDSVIQEKDISINQLQHELFDKDKLSEKWRRRYWKIKRLYQKKCLEFEESLAYLDIEGEQNKILEQKTIELQARVDTEIKLIKAEWEDIILERDNEYKDELVLLYNTIKEKDEEIKKYKIAYGELEDETTSLLKNLKIQLINKDAEIQSIQEQINVNEDMEISKKVDKITELERKLVSMRQHHEEELTHMKEQIEKYKELLREKDMDNETKILDFSASYRQKESKSKADIFKLKKETDVKNKCNF